MYCDALDNLIGKTVTVFLYKETKDTALKGTLLDVGQDYIVISGRYEGERNLIPMRAVTNVMVPAE
jgi:hypothetical protein